jgi:gliding motility-associated-like protein
MVSKTFGSAVAFLLFLSTVLQAQTVSITLTTGLSNSSYACQNSIITAKANVSPSGTYTYAWDMGNGVTVEDTARSIQTVYPTAGDFTINVTVKSGATTIASSSKSLHVYKLPNADFIVSGHNKLCVGSDMVLLASDTTNTNHSTGFVWEFSDGTKTQGYNPSFKVVMAQMYSVTLKVTDKNGCVNSSTQTGIVDVRNKAMASFTASQSEVCKIPDTVYFTSTSSGPGTLLYSWDFDGVTDSRQNAERIYNSYGWKKIKLSVSSADYYGCTSVTAAKDSIEVYEVRAEGNVWKDGSVIGSTSTICYGAVQCKNKSIGVDASQIKWDFGDGTVANYADSIVHNYNNAGVYTLKLIAMPGTECESVKTWTITVEKAVASFSMVPDYSCFVTQSVTFTNNSTNATTYLWEFPDGTSADPNPVRTLSAGVDADPYASHNEKKLTITLNAFTSIGCKTTTTSTFTFRRPSATFEVDTASGCLPLTVKFDGSNPASNEPIQSFRWVFGDGQEGTTLGTVPVISHVYSTAGVFDAKLVITNTAGCADTSYSIRIKVGKIPHTKFTVSPNSSICPDQLITITDQTDASYAVDFWDYKANGVSIGSTVNPSPSFRLGVTGNVSITLRSGSNGCYNDTTVANVLVEKGPSSAFSYKLNCDAPYTYSFTSAATNAASYYWDYGDGNTASTSSPSHTFPSSPAEKDYTVKFITSDGTGCSDTATKIVMVRTSNVSLTIPANTCARTPVTINATGSSIANSWCHDNYSWTFNDGTQSVRTEGKSVQHSFPSRGSFRVKLSAFFDNGCTDTISQNIRVYEPYAKIQVNSDTVGCLPLSVSFTDVSAPDGNALKNWDWFLSGGPSYSYTTGGQTVTNTYNNSGEFPVVLRVTDVLGCVGYDTVHVTGSKPNAKFQAITDSIICSKDGVLFEYISYKDSALWEFGDGEVLRDEKTPYHTYIKGGKFDVKLTVYHAGCSDSYTKSQYITVIKPDASFQMSSLESGYQTNDTVFNCYPVNVQFTHLYANSNIFDGKWSFGQNGTTTDYYPDPQKVFQYTNPGSYQVGLGIEQYYNPDNTVVEKFCYDTVKHTITITGPAGAMNINPQNACRENAVTFSIKDTANIGSYGWNFLDGTVVNNMPSVVHQFALVDTLFKRPVRLLLNNKQGSCNAYITDTVYFEKIEGIIEMTFGKTSETDTTLCSGKSLLFKNSTLNSASQTWYFGDGAYSAFDNPVHGYAPGNYICRLAVTSANGCIDTAYLPLHIFPTPDLKLAFDSSKCIENKALILATPYGAKITWTPTDGLYLYSGDSIAEASPAQTTKYVVKAQYPTGCSQSDSIIITRPHAVMTVSRDFVAVGDSVHVIVTDTSDVASFTWTPASGFSCTNCLDPIVRPRSPKYYLILTEPLGCFSDTLRFSMSIDSVNINVFAPTAFVPGDPENGVFKLVGSGLPGAYPDDFKLEIFNRWGNLVFSTTNKDEGWDGAYKGKVQPIDSYVWVATVKLWNGETKKFKGTVMIIK